MRFDFPIYLLRHGQTDWNRERRLQGWLDTELNATGRTQAAAQAQIMRAVQTGTKPLPLYSSPLTRAVQTADILGAQLGAAPILDDRLREVHMGAWQGLTHAEIASRWPEAYHSHSTDFHLSINTKDGETLEALSQRLDSFLQGIYGPSIIVTHGIALQYMRGQLLGLDLAATANLGHEQAVIYAIQAGVENILRA